MRDLFCAVLCYYRSCRCNYSIIFKVNKARLVGMVVALRYCTADGIDADNCHDLGLIPLVKWIKSI